MAAAPEVIAAFESGSGLPVATFHDVATVVLAGVSLVWLAWTVLRVGERVLEQRMTPAAAFNAALRAVVLVLLIVFYLVA